MTLDVMLALQLQSEIHHELNPLHVAFNDLKVYFDSVDRDALWTVMKGIGTLGMIQELIREQ